MNKKKPDIVLKRTERGGVQITKVTPLTKLTDEMIKQVLHEYRIVSADVQFRCDATVDELIDVIEGNRVYMPCVYVLNKIDSLYIEELDLLDKVPHYVCISAKDKWNLDELVEQIWIELDLIRIYTKPKGQAPDYAEPVIISRKKSSVIDLCNKIHKRMADDFKEAIVWGSSVKHSPQRVGKKHLLEDEDVIQIIKK